MTQTALQFVLSLRPALPMSVEKPCKVASNSEVRRWIKDGSVLINGERWDPDEEICPIRWSIVFFPNSKAREGQRSRRTTIL
jgi:hypothetical protein